MRTSVDVTPFEIPLEFPRDRLSTGFGEFGRVASLLQLPDVIGDFLIVLGELVDTFLFCAIAASAIGITGTGGFLNYFVVGVLFKVAVELLVMPVTVLVIARLKAAEPTY